MPVMHKMRENTHIILFFLLIMFLLSMTIGGLVGGADITHLFSRRPDLVSLQLISAFCSSVSGCRTNEMSGRLIKKQQFLYEIRTRLRQLNRRRT